MAKKVTVEKLTIELNRIKSYAEEIEKIMEDNDPRGGPVSVRSHKKVITLATKIKKVTDKYPLEDE